MRLAWLRLIEMFNPAPNPEYIARKIQVERWEITSYTTGIDDVRVDSVTGRCLTTDEEKLSVWMCQNEENDVAQVALALATGYYVKDSLYIALLRKDLLEKAGFTFENSDGDTKVADLRSRHVDIINLDIPKLVRIATEITLNVRQDSLLFQYTQQQVLDLIKNAIEEGRLNLKDLKSDYQKLLKKA
jgi:hypothetical protein